ncbi:MAG: hypothetical protein KGJ86_08170 [Chloroflexota bacterium]|nr:hypothetical protein [Chloroflexota bacterium]
MDHWGFMQGRLREREQPDVAQLKEWLLNHLPATVAAAEPDISVDGDEILIVLKLNTSSIAEEQNRPEAERALIERRRNETRGLRTQAGRRLGRSFGRAVSWGMQAGDSLELFTNNTAPVMTRLSRQERHVLDALITAKVANTRSGALGYVVRTFAAEHQEWLAEVQEAMSRVAGLREKLKTEQRPGPPPANA